MRYSFQDREGYYIDKCGMCAHLPINDISKATPRGYICPMHNSGWLSSGIGMAFEDTPCRKFVPDRHRTHKDIKKAYEALKRKCGRYDPKDYWSYIMTAIKEILQTDEAKDDWEILGSFRDDYMQNKLEYFGTLATYDMYGRLISEALRKDAHREIIAQMLLDNYISQVIAFIKSENYQEAIILYEQMVMILRDCYLVPNYESPSLSLDQIRSLKKN